MNAVAGAGAAVEEGSRRSDAIQRLTILQPDDWHLHLRDGEALTAVAPLR
jgi:dihydroorotase